MHNYLHFSFVVVFVYDCFLTFPDEVERVWKRLRIRASRWYLINRYFTLAGFILVSLSMTRGTEIDPNDVFA